MSFLARAWMTVWSGTSLCRVRNPWPLPLIVVWFWPTPPVFLTKLEYYQGIVFLTTNCFSRINYAFQSRVDLLLPYHDLDSQALKQVWHNRFFEHFRPDRFDVSPDEIDQPSELLLNSREINNLLKSAQLLSSRMGRKATANRLNMLADKWVTALRMLQENNALVGR
jgi:hypothetical protein